MSEYNIRVLKKLLFEIIYLASKVHRKFYVLDLWFVSLFVSKI